MKLFIALASAACLTATSLSAQQKLTGTPIGSSPSVDYSNPSFPASTTVNTPKDAFDGDFNTCYASYDRSYTWVGLDLGKPHVISRVGFSPRNDGLGPGRLQLAIIEGANSPDFMDAVPVYMITTSTAPIGSMTYADVNCSRGFRYVRFVGPSNSRCNIAELEFYGTEGAGDDSALYQLTNLPTVVINTVDAEEPYDKEHDIVAQVKIISENGSKVLDASATTRLRGNASMQFPKKPYRIKFDKKQNVLDAPAKAKKWTLINNYGDKTLLRNDIAFEIARRLEMEYVPYIQPVDVILNGEYKGNYQLCDQVEVNSGRLDIEEMEPTDTEGEALTGGYFVEIDGYADQEISWFCSNKGIPVTIKSPDEDEITTEQSNYIRDYFNELENRLWISTTNKRSDYRKIFDTQSFLKHFLVGEIAGNTDTYWSTYMYKRRGNPVVYTGPVWDFDIAFENDNRTYPINAISGYLFMSSKASAAADNMRYFTRRVVEMDPLSHTDIRDMWDYAAANKGLTAESLNDYIDSRAAYIESSQKLNFMRWPIMNEWVHQNPVISGSYEGELSRVKNYVTDRFDHLWGIISQYEASGFEDAVISTGEIFGYAGEIALKGFAANSTYSVYDMTGREISSGLFSGDRLLSVSTGSLYLVKVVDGYSGNVSVKKFCF